MSSHNLLIDQRFGDGDRYSLTPPEDIHMRVPNQITKAVLFVGLPEIPDPEYRGTAFIVTVPGSPTKVVYGGVEVEVRYPVAFLMTARHIVEKISKVGDGEFYIRANKKSGGVREIRVQSDTKWWYHPTEKDYVDCAATLFPVEWLAELDVAPIPIGMFADEKVISKHNIGIGDEVFITGLFTKVVDTTKNIPIVRTGTVAMLPGEKIPFGNSMIEAYLVESRSIGGLSGSPVFVRETMTIKVLSDFEASFMARTGRKFNPFDGSPLQGVGQFFFFGSVIGHWSALPGFSELAPIEEEKVNMGIAPIVPAHKIIEVLTQPEVVETMKKNDEKIRAKNQEGATYDFAAKHEDFSLTKEGFEAALKKASRRMPKDE